MLCYATVLFKNHDNNEDLNLAFFNTAVTEINSILLKKETTKLTKYDNKFPYPSICDHSYIQQ